MATTALSGPERRRRWTSEQMAQIVEESLVEGAKVAAVARRHDVHPNLIYGWRRQKRAGGLSATRAGGVQFVPVAVAPVRDAWTASARGFEAGPAIEVVLRNGRVLRVPDGALPERAVALADALEGIVR
jgi:transposase